MTGFEWLTPDRLVQLTRFGSQAQLTANFGSAAYPQVKPGCIRLRWIASKKERTFCPSARQQQN